MMSKIQNLNGTHNNDVINCFFVTVVYDVKDTKFEWNSQLVIYVWMRTNGCLWCQRYKIWMELTTTRHRSRSNWLLFMMSKIQNLNGTHNCVCDGIAWVWVVYDVKDTKFEWNSQQMKQRQSKHEVVYDVKDTKFEWNSQLRTSSRSSLSCCLWCQRYKIWMELTTAHTHVHVRI